MKKYITGFVLNGLFVCGFGPIVFAIICTILSASGYIDMISIADMVLGIVSVTVLAFIAGGINIVYKIEKLPLIAAIFIHAIVLYIDYIVIYLMNGWLKRGVTPILVFTACFVVGFALLWVIIYFTTRNSANKMNSRLASMQHEFK